MAQVALRDTPAVTQAYIARLTDFESLAAAGAPTVLSSPSPSSS